MNFENFNDSLFGVKPVKNSVIQPGGNMSKWISNQAKKIIEQYFFYVFVILS